MKISKINNSQMHNFYSLDKNKFLAISILVLSFFSFAACFSQASFQEDVVESENPENQSQVEFLFGISQLILQDKDRLKSLKEDSIFLEPLFNKTARKLNEVNGKLGYLKSSDILNEKSTNNKLERENLKRSLEYILKRRRAIHQQLKILERKIHIEREAFSLAMKGKSTLVLEQTDYGKQESTKIVDFDSLNISDTLIVNDDILFERLKNEYNWDIVEKERELDILKANFEIANKKWVLLNQLLVINQDDFTTVQYLFRSSREHIDFLRNLKSLETPNTIPRQSVDTTDQIPEVLQDTSQLALFRDNQIEVLVSEDSLLLGNIQYRIENLTKLIAPLQAEIAHFADEISGKNSELDYLRSPWSLQRIKSFIITKGPRIIIILLILFLIWFIARWVVVKVLHGLNLRKADIEDRSERAETLRRTIHSGITIVMIFVGALLLLSEFGINISVILGGAAVFSLAIAFGAQSLVKDFFSGFMILSEDQYRVGNVIRINETQGIVEDISLRTTILRDLEGVAHFIPHGNITTVSNLTYKWSRVALEIGVAYKENVDQVMEIILKVAHELRLEEDFKNLITGDPEMLGVDEFRDSAVIIKILLTTRPQKQWLVKREFLRRLKNRFDDLGIEIPFPHRTIYLKDSPVPALYGKKPENK